MTKLQRRCAPTPAALLHNGGRFASESLADFSGIRSHETLRSSGGLFGKASIASARPCDWVIEAPTP
jgi:hypothetical protein